MNKSIPTYQDISQGEGLAFKVGQLFMPAAFINDTEDAIQEMESLIREYNIGGLCFFHSPASAATNFEGEKEIPHNPDSLGTLKTLIARYQKASRHPLLIAIDAEWGLAMRVENGEPYPYALTLGALAPGHSLVYQTGLRMAAECREVGIHWNLAPVADINLNPGNPVIGYRAFGSDPKAVASHVQTFYRGLRDGGLLGCAKHFPGHGDTDVDSHLELPSLNKPKELLEEVELLPFCRLMEEGVDAVMTGHLAVPSVDPSGFPASLSGSMIRQWLRNELGYTGVVITDALNMRAVQKKFPGKGELAYQALLAGNDILCFAEEIPSAIQRICREAPTASIEDAFKRVWQLKTKAFSEPWKVGNPLSKSSRETEQVKELPVLPQYSPAELREALASDCLTLHHTAVKDAEVSDAPMELSGSTQPQTPFTPQTPFPLPTPFTLLTAGSGLQAFSEYLLEGFEATHLQWDIKAGNSLEFEMPKTHTVLLALAPPSIKPAHSFGIHPHALPALQSLIKERQVYLCHFGNPYAMELLPFDSAAQVLIAYQDLEEFQRQAARFYLGQVKAPGKLPVSIKPLSR